MYFQIVMLMHFYVSPETHLLVLKMQFYVSPETIFLVFFLKIIPRFQVAISLFIWGYLAPKYLYLVGYQHYALVANIPIDYVTVILT